jgi:hypothetical protein
MISPLVRPLFMNLKLSGGAGIRLKVLDTPVTNSDFRAFGDFERFLRSFVGGLRRVGCNSCGARELYRENSKYAVKIAIMSVERDVIVVSFA